VAKHDHPRCTACDELQEESEAASRAKDDFFLTLSHELRGPLNAITGWVHVLRTRALADPLAARAVETIERNVRAQARLITDMLDISQVITGKLRLVHRSVDLAALVTESAQSLGPSSDGREIRVETESTVGTISADPDRLRQVMDNLLHNALKFTPEGGRITVRVVGNATNVAIAVQDSGTGIRPDVLPHVFERFWQDESRTQVGGLGIGLAVVRHLVELHGGTVSAASEGENHGATFTVTLPVREQVPPPNGDSSAAAAESESAR
jgi:signal transduction histidine kinase